MPYDKELLIKYRISRSKETIEDARIAIENSRLFAAENRIYYSIFYIVSALALKDGFSTSKHGQLLGWFNKNYVKTGLITSEIGKIYANAFENRQEIDYQDFIKIKLSDVKKHFREMIQFVETIERLL